MELIPLCQALETTSHISHCSTPSQVLTTSHLLLQAWDIQVQLLGYHSLILCASTTFLMSFTTHQLLASISLLVLWMEVRFHLLNIYVVPYNIYEI